MNPLSGPAAYEQIPKEVEDLRQHVVAAVSGEEGICTLYMLLRRYRERKGYVRFAHPTLLPGPRKVLHKWVASWPRRQ
jgi:hypothetical protein